MVGTIVCLGIAVSVALFAGCMTIPSVGFPLWIVLMIVIWLTIPNIITKYYDSGQFEKKDTSFKIQYYKDHPYTIYCPVCIDGDIKILHSQTNQSAQTTLYVCRCNKCGKFFTALKDDNFRSSTRKNTVLTAISDDEAHELCKQPRIIN